MDTPLQYSRREKCWTLPGCFFREYVCSNPMTKEMSDFVDNCLAPAVRGIIENFEKSNTPELRRQYKEGVLSRGPSSLEWFI
jgi:hypothetical protein